MPRLSSPRILCPLIHRSFAPSRLERQLLTYAFAQALPVVRRQLPRDSQYHVISCDDIAISKSQCASGGRS